MSEVFAYYRLRANTGYITWGNLKMTMLEVFYLLHLVNEWHSAPIWAVKQKARPWEGRKYSTIVDWRILLGRPLDVFSSGSVSLTFYFSFIILNLLCTRFNYCINLMQMFIYFQCCHHMVIRDGLARWRSHKGECIGHVDIDIGRLRYMRSLQNDDNLICVSFK